MAAIAMQPAPRMNFPDEPSYTYEKVMALASRFIETHSRALAKDIRRIVDENVTRWAARRSKEPVLPPVQVSMDLYSEQLAFKITPCENEKRIKDENAMDVDGEEAGAKLLSVRMEMVPKVALGVTVMGRPGAAPSPAPRRGGGRGVSRAPTPPLPGQSGQTSAAKYVPTAHAPCVTLLVWAL